MSRRQLEEDNADLRKFVDHQQVRLFSPTCPCCNSCFFQIKLWLQDTDSLREHQQQELSSKLLVAEGALATMKEELGAQASRHAEELGAQASRHAEELQRLEASLETASAARQDLQYQLDTATERVQQLETELKVSPPSRCQQSDPTLTGAAQNLQINKAKVDDASKLLSDMTMKMKMALACEAEQVRVIA